MLKTKHDLSAGHAKINLNELIKTVQIAVGRSRHEVERRLNEIQSMQLYERNKHYDIAILAESLASASADLAESTKTLYYLENSKSRDIGVDKRE